MRNTTFKIFLRFLHTIIVAMMFCIVVACYLLIGMWQYIFTGSNGFMALVIDQLDEYNDDIEAWINSYKTGFAR